MRAIALVLLAIGTAPQAVALDPSRKITQYQSRHWGPEDGLPCNNVLSVTQTADGYLWLGTQEGLVRFDGVRGQVFHRRIDQTLVSDNVSQVIDDARHPGAPLFVTSSGMHGQALGNDLQMALPNLAPTHQPGKIFIQDPRAGTLWIGTLRGLYRVGSGGDVTGSGEGSPDWPAEPITALCQDGDGRLWVGSARGIYRQKEAGDGRSFELLADWRGGEVDGITTSRAGGLWVGSHDGGIGRLDQDKVFHPRALAGCVATSFLEDRDGNLWVGTLGSGLYRLPAVDAPGAGAAPVAFTKVDGLPDNQVNSLCEDREGNLWVATAAGLLMLQDARFAEYGSPEGLAVDGAVAVFEDHDDRLWIGTDDGLSMLDAARVQITNYPLPPSPWRPNDNLVLCLGPGDDGETLLIGTHAGLLRRRNGKLEAWPLRDDLDRSAVQALCLGADGTRWVATNNGIFGLRGEQVVAHVTTAEGLANNVARALLADRAGNLWITTNGGLSRRAPDGRITNFLTTGVGHSLSLLDAHNDTGDIFVGTELGLQRVRTGPDGSVKITAYTTHDGFFENTILNMLDDAHGNLWMSSNNSVMCLAWADLARLDRREITTIPSAHFGIHDGLRSREVNGGRQRTAWPDHSGVLWFATARGAAMVDPAGRRGAEPSPPPAVIEELTADGHPLPVTPHAAAPALPPGTQRFELRYTALSLSAPESNRFRYRLEPFDAQWTNAGTERVAHYTNVPPGHYRFRLQAANGAGVWNEEGAVLDFSLEAHLYQLIWFRLLVAGTVVMAGWLWLRQHKRQLVARAEKAEADVRERIRHQETLRAAKEEAESARAEAEQANEAKSVFLSRMSHELRTPLNAILGFGQILEMSELRTAEQDCTSHILRAGRHLLGLVNDVLDIASIETGHANLSLEPVSMADVIQECLSLVRSMAAQRGVQMDAGELTRDGSYVLADRQRLRQVLLNFLANAIKYNRQGGAVTISLREVPPGPPTPADERSPRLRLEVADTGSGLDAAQIARLFVPFERVGAERSNIEGSGLGLALSKHLTEAMGGRIGVESQADQGSTFWIELPRTESPLAHLEQLKLPAADMTEGSAGVVLYIEDNFSNLRLIERVFQLRPGIELLSAKQGDLGLEIAMSRHPDLILLDLHLPDIPGWEVLARLQANPSLRDIPVVVLSADATTRQIEKLMNAGARAYLTKPVDVSELLRVLDEHLSFGRNNVPAVPVG